MAPRGSAFSPGTALRLRRAARRSGVLCKSDGFEVESSRFILGLDTSYNRIIHITRERHHTEVFKFSTTSDLDGFSKSFFLLRHST